MELEKTVENQIADSSLFCLKNSLSWILVLAPLITFATFFIFGSLSIFFTSTVLMLSTVVFIFSRRKLPKLVKIKSSAAKEEYFDKSGDKEISSHQIEDPLASKQQHGSEGDDYLMRSPDVLSENECVDYQLSTTEDSEVEWPFRDNMDRSPDYSDDGSISDEDSLIEISLPGGHYVHSSHKEEEPPKFSMQQKLATDFVPESFFQQRSLMELLAELNEMNEEENLIEIDISMGSIKCSRFEIEA